MRKSSSRSVTILFSLLALIFIYPLGIIGQKFRPCYQPNGDENDRTSYRPCNDIEGQPDKTNEHSMCCFYTGDGSTLEACLPNGLCAGTSSDGNGTQLWRESCTDPTWKSPNCLILCMTSDVGDQPITLCPDGSYCCGENNTNCCKNKQGTFLPPLMNQQSDPSSSKASPTSTSTSSISTASESGSKIPPSPTSSGGSSTGQQSTTATETNVPSSNSGTAQLNSQSTSQITKIAIGIGATAIFMVLVAAGSAVAIYFYRRRSKSPIDAEDIGKPELESTSAGAQYFRDPQRRSQARTIVGGELPVEYNTGYTQRHQSARDGTGFEMI
ncbi:hypothetical protein TWF696_000258 [Orbilia brochopaga]|uniref:Mid2 domain-containing protein n=1 Tax=Orbilia brochopaga TaxID=3140254 RepID=A0AAV9VDU4_9PEZI